MVWGTLIIAALFAFELFNYSTTDFAMHDLLGDLRFVGIRWSTILAIAFCGIDFAGVARLFTPEQGAEEPAEVWYLFGAWLLAAAMNAMLTWWGVSTAIAANPALGNEVVNREILLKVVPIFVAVMVWVIRVLIIGTFSVAGERLFSQANTGSRTSRSPQTKSFNKRATTTSNNYRRSTQSSPMRASSSSYRPAPKTSRPDPTYHPVSGSSQNSNATYQQRNFSSNASKNNGSYYDPMG
jgi:hypothetical protein